MNAKKIKELKHTIELLKTEKGYVESKLNELETQLFNVRKEMFQKKHKTKIAKIVQDALESRELTSMPHDEWLHTYIHPDLSFCKDEVELEILQSILQDECLNLDLENEAVSQCIGPAIIINQDYRDRHETIYDQESMKTIADLSEFETKQDLVNFLEAYQTKQGIFNSIVVYRGDDFFEFFNSKGDGS